MTQMTTSSVRSSLEIYEVKPGTKFPLQLLRDMLPDAETALFFGKVYELDYGQLSGLLHSVLRSDLAKVLFKGDHSTDLQGYLVDVCDPMSSIDEQDITYSPNVPAGEILPEVWKSLEITVAKSIKDVASKLNEQVSRLPGKQGAMLFKSMQVLNSRRPTVGDYRAGIGHARQKPNLCIMDDSGSMTEHTVKAIVDDVVAMSYNADAHFALVSDSTRHWEPGNYDSASVLSKTEFGGTHYETLAELLSRDWGTVICIADYDSSNSAAEYIAANAKGTIDEVVDISLVNRPTYLAEVVGQLAAKVTPVLIGQGRYITS